MIYTHHSARVGAVQELGQCAAKPHSSVSTKCDVKPKFELRSLYNLTRTGE